MKKISIFWIIALSVFALSLSSCQSDDLNEGVAIDGKHTPELASAEVAFPGVERSVVKVGDVTLTQVGENFILGSDILLSPEQVASMVQPASRGAASVDLTKNWNNGVIYYSFGTGFTSASISTIKAAIAHWETNTSFRFVQRTAQKDYVEFVNAGGNWSYVGRIGGKQQLSLSATASMGNAAHEIGHLVGLFHEHSRTDRDKYVTVRWDKVAVGYEHDFYIYTQSGYKGEDVAAFDFSSIMLYSAYSFSKDGSATILKVNGMPYTAQRTALSAGDIAAAKRIYERSAVKEEVVPDPIPEIPVVPETPVTPETKKNNGNNKNNGSTTTTETKTNNGNGKNK